MAFNQRLEGKASGNVAEVNASNEMLVALSADEATAGFADIVRAFQVPLVVDGGRYFHVILAIPSGAQTAALVFRGAVSVDGYFE